MIRCDTQGHTTRSNLVSMAMARHLTITTQLKVALYNTQNQMNEINDSRGRRCCKIGTRTRKIFKFGSNVHKYLKNQRMPCIIKYFSFYANERVIKQAINS